MQKVVLITGASRGIGAATALLAAEHNYAVCINYLQDHRAAQQILELIKSMGGNAIAVQADVSDEKQVLSLFETIDHKLGKINALVNNAGILAPQMRIDKMDAVRLNKIFSTNITGYFMCAKQAILRMSTKYGGDGGAIVNVSSAASRLGSAGEYVDYAASKGAIDSFSIGLAKEVAAEEIRVNAVRPGFIYTDIHASGGDAERVAKLEQFLPMQRGGEPAEALLNKCKFRVRFPQVVLLTHIFQLAIA